MKRAAGWTSMMASVASRLAFAMCLVAVTNARSLFRHSFHRPSWAEKCAATYISLIGVYSLTQGKRSAKARA